MRATRAPASDLGESFLNLTFLTPVGVLLALACVLPLGAFYVVRRRARRTRAAMDLPEPSLRSYGPPLGAIVLVGCLLGLAASQPVLELRDTVRVRTDAEALLVIDTSKSMLARRGRDGATRLARAKADALVVRNALPTLRVGLASVTDRTLPYLFPSADENVFRTTLAQ